MCLNIVLRDIYNIATRAGLLASLLFSGLPTRQTANSGLNH